MSEHIHVFVRHCNTSSNSVNKIRPPWFSRPKCLQNLLATKDEHVSVTILMDGDNETHFTSQFSGLKIVPVKGGCDASSFRALIHHVFQGYLGDDAIIYLLEDDYVHRPGWPTAMREIFASNKANYVTLYDHSDKYTLPVYNDLASRMLVTKSGHWRTTPSTTNTYAARLGTLRKHKDVHIEYSVLEQKFTFDDLKFRHLQERLGAVLVSSVPGFSAHCETAYLSPVIDWENVMNETTAGLPVIQDGP